MPGTTSAQCECQVGTTGALTAVALSYARRPSLAAMRVWYASASSSEYRPTAASAASYAHAAYQAQDLSIALSVAQALLSQPPAMTRPLLRLRMSGAGSWRRWGLSRPALGSCQRAGGRPSQPGNNPATTAWTQEHAENRAEKCMLGRAAFKEHEPRPLHALQSGALVKARHHKHWRSIALQPRAATRRPPGALCAPRRGAH